MTPAFRNLIKFLAQVAVEQYLNELRAPEKLLPSDGRHSACEHDAARTTNAKE